MSTELASRRVGFLGGGAMAQALATGLVRAGVPARQILASDPDPGRREALAGGPGVRAVADNAEVVEASDLVVLAVKPGVVGAVLRALEVLPEATRLRPLWLSIAAGVPLASLEEGLPRGARVVRAMPNTPSLVGAGATALVANASASEADRGLARALFECVGIVWEAPAEDLLDAVTGLSGSGPAYVCVFLEALADAGVRMGLPREAAYALSFQTVLGTARLAQETGRHPADLKDQVTSPGGTTIAGLERLEAGGLRAAVHAAVAAATERSRELGKKR
jgi:pyrroline-5-carboxylate reductase